MANNKTTEEVINDKSMFGAEEIQITKEDLEKAKKENEKDKEALEVPTFISVNTEQ